MNLRQCIYILIAIIATSCVPPTYMAISSTSRLSDLDSRTKKTILISSHHIQNADRFALLINQRKTLEFEKEIATIEDINKRRFLRGVQSLVAGDHEKAYVDLSLLPQSSFDYEVQLLMTDILRAKKTPYLDYPRIYQIVVDSTKDETIKSIAIKRYRFLKYENSLQ